MLDNVNIDPLLIESTIVDLSESIDRLNEQRTGMEDDLAAMNERIKSLEVRRDQWKVLFEKLSAEASGRPRRRKKGEGEKAIVAVLEALPEGESMTLTQIVSTTKMPWSTVRNVIKNNPEKFETEGSACRLKKGLAA